MSHKNGLDGVINYKLEKLFDLRNKLLLFVKSKNDNIFGHNNIENKHGTRIAD